MTPTIEIVPVVVETDVVIVRARVREAAIALGFRALDQTKLITVASELSRNILRHATRGTVRIEAVTDDGRAGLRMTFDDEGPGIANTALALTDGYTTAGGMGLGLGGSKRLVDDFEISAGEGSGARVRVTKWK